MSPPSLLDLQTLLLSCELQKCLNWLQFVYTNYLNYISSYKIQIKNEKEVYIYEFSENYSLSVLFNLQRLHYGCTFE